MKEPKIANSFLSYLYLAFCFTALAMTAATGVNLKEPKVRVSHPLLRPQPNSAPSVKIESKTSPEPRRESRY